MKRRTTVITIVATGVFAFATVGIIRAILFRSAFQRGTACISNLHQIHLAKERYIDGHHPTKGTPITWEDLPEFADLRFMQCPDGGTYSINPVGKVPTCSYSAEWMRRYPDDMMTSGRIMLIRHQLYSDMEAKDGLR